MRFDLTGLLKLLPPAFAWMRKRISSMWVDWLKAAKNFQKNNYAWRKKKVNIIRNDMELLHGDFNCGILK